MNNETWEVRQSETAWDICLPVRPGERGVAVVATVYAGEAVARQIVAAHNKAKGETE